MMMTYYDFENFIFSMFQFLDGYIGPIKSSGYKVINEVDEKIALTRPFNSIEIYEGNFNEYIKSANTNNLNFIKTLITEIVAHELSHVNQKINFFAAACCGFGDYIDFIERTNVHNSINFLINKQNEIYRNFGFILNTEWLKYKHDNLVKEKENFISKEAYVEECWEQSLRLLFENNKFTTFENIYLNNGEFIIKQHNAYNYNKIVANRLDEFVADSVMFKQSSITDNSLFVISQ